ncbi:NAD(P)/FAD-dependent oxidoreductase [Haloferacaceae archaeon DSL9]
MARVAIIGGGPAGLSAALFTAKNDLETVVFDTDDTGMHNAHLRNYLGIESIDGTEFIERAREQVRDFGAELSYEEVEQIEQNGASFTLTTDEGEHDADYVVLGPGQERGIADELDIERQDNGAVVADQDRKTSVDGVYAVGWLARKKKIQAAISVGDGAAAALDILSTEKGSDFNDFEPPDNPHA